MELIKGVMLLLALSALYSVGCRVWRQSPRLESVATGALFGAFCILSMLMPLAFAPGLLLDWRSVLLSLSGLFGGVLSGATALALAGAFRYWQGGVDVALALAVMVGCVAAGLLYRQLLQQGWAKVNAGQLLLFGGMVHAALYAVSSMVPIGAAPDLSLALEVQYVLSGLLFAAATLVLGWLLQDSLERQRCERAARESVTRLQHLVQDMPGISVQGYATDGTVVYWNQASEMLYGYSAQEALGRRRLDLIIPAALRERVQFDMQAMLASSKPAAACEMTLRRKDGAPVQVLSSHVLCGSAEGEPELFCIDMDLSGRTQEHAEMRIAAAAFDAQEGMIVTDPQKIIMRVNRAFTQSVGYTEEEAVGQSLALFNSGRQDDDFYARMNQELHERGQWAGELWSRRKNGEIFPEWVNITAVLDDCGRVTHYVARLTDISQRKAAEEQIRQLAFFDPLTGLPNRRMLMDRLYRALAASARTKRRGALLFIDLDHFKTLNDTLGHERGDLLLKQVADRLVGCVREVDTVARVGGDEFVVMLEDLDEVREVAGAEAKMVGEKIVLLINQPYRLVDVDFHSSPSIGVAMYYGNSVPMEELLKQADLAMYKTKAEGRNGMRFFDPAMQSLVNSRAKLEADVRQGILLDQFVLHYQPQVDALGNVIGAEALLRWPHPVRGMVSPCEFIPLAEETGQILLLGNWVLQSVCEQLVEWSRHPARAHLTLSVNVSARQFYEKGFVGYVLGLLDYTGVDPSKLKIELTESMLAEDLENIVGKMTLLRARGIGFALDDFGTGYSSLSYLKKLPLDQLKIDQSFVRDVLTDPNDAAIAQMVVALARSLGLGVIAEGVETEAQRLLLAEQGCLLYQGHLFSPALPVQGFEHLLETGSTRVSVSF